MLVLAFDTSTPWCSVAAGDGKHWLQREEHVGQKHSERLLPMVQALLAEGRWNMADVAGIAFGAGPGSFTGIRIACSVAQGLAFGLGCPVAPVSTLAAVAQEARRSYAAEACLVCLDARMAEVYVGAYLHTPEGWQEERPPAVLPPSAVRVPDAGTSWQGVGNGFDAYPELAACPGLARIHPEVRATARAVLEIGRDALGAGRGVAAEEALPVYVRQRVALTTAEREAGLRL